MLNHASYHHEVCRCGDPWCHGCPTNEEFDAERDAEHRIALPADLECPEGFYWDGRQCLRRDNLLRMTTYEREAM